MKISNKNARDCVTNLEEFKGNNTFAVWEGNKYVVYSYGKHWILYMNFNNEWYGCNERRSVSTTKHSSQLHPNADINHWLTQDDLQSVLKYNILNH